MNKAGEGRASKTDSRGEYGSALHMAASRTFPRITALLLTNGANVEILDANGETPLHVAAAKGATNNLLQLIRAGADVNSLGDERQTGRATPLFLATEERHIDAVRLLLENGANPNLPAHFRGRSGVPPLLLAAEAGNPEITSLLLKGGAEIEAKDSEGNTALSLAIQSSNPDTVKILLDNGATPNTQFRGYPVLSLSIADRQNNGVLAELLRAKADVNAFDHAGETPLHRAVRMKRKDFVEQLLVAGADPNLRNKEGKTPLDLSLQPPVPVIPIAGLDRSAQSASPSEIAALLRKHGALDDLPDFDAIRITRQGFSQPLSVFRKGELTNQFTLLETVMHFYSETSKMAGHDSFPSPTWAMAFPDFERVIIRRPSRKPGDKEQEIKVNLLRDNLLDCAADVPVEFGDVIEIPERVHALNESHVNPATQIQQMFQTAKSTLTNTVPFAMRAAENSPLEAARQAAAKLACLQKSVQLVVAGASTTLTIDSWKEGFLNQALSKMQARSALRSSSDLSRVRVTRKDSVTGKSAMFIVDASNNQKQFWLLDGDVIEVPEK